MQWSRRSSIACCRTRSPFDSAIARELARTHEAECDECAQHERRDREERSAPREARHAAEKIEGIADHERTDEAACVAERRMHRERRAAARGLGGSRRTRGERRRI